MVHADVDRGDIELLCGECTNAEQRSRRALFRVVTGSEALLTAQRCRLHGWMQGTINGTR